MSSSPSIANEETYSMLYQSSKIRISILTFALTMSAFPKNGKLDALPRNVLALARRAGRGREGRLLLLRPNTKTVHSFTREVVVLEFG